jgi:hypothetical protein
MFVWRVPCGDPPDRERVQFANDGLIRAGPGGRDDPLRAIALDVVRPRDGAVHPPEHVELALELLLRSVQEVAPVLDHELVQEDRMRVYEVPVWTGFFNEYARSEL